jgi:hypothetical protein
MLSSSESKDLHLLSQPLDLFKGRSVFHVEFECFGDWTRSTHVGDGSGVQVSVRSLNDCPINAAKDGAEQVHFLDHIVVRVKSHAVSNVVGMLDESALG